MKTLKIFLIDDDVDDLEIFSFALENIGHPVDCYTASDGTEAIAILNREKDFIPDYIFVDLNMPKMDGRSCLTEIKKIERLKNTPVIIYSTSTARKDIVETQELGATSYISKPSSISTLTTILKEVFGVS